MKKSSSPSLVAIIAIIVIVIAAGGFALYSATRPNSSSSNNTTDDGMTSSVMVSTQFVTSLAQAHWMAIGQGNVSLVMSQYSTAYEAVWFFISNGSLGPSNGRYDCNIPRGPGNCSYFPSSAWTTLFNNAGSLNNYTICALNVTAELLGRVVVQAVAWYSLSVHNETLKVPYEMDFQYSNGTWALWKEFFGLQQNPAIVFVGLRQPPSSCRLTT